MTKAHTASWLMGIAVGVPLLYFFVFGEYAAAFGVAGGRSRSSLGECWRARLHDDRCGGDTSSGMEREP